VIRVVLSGTYSSAKWANVLHARYPGTGLTIADANTLCGNFISTWSTTLGTLQEQSSLLTQVQITDLTSTSAAQGQSTANAAGSGGLGSGLPANVALVLSWKILRRYRGGHPRTYITAQRSTNTTLNTTWSGGWQTSALAAARAFRTAVNAMTTTSSGTLVMCNLSYYTGRELRPTPVADDITDAAVHTRIDTQRRRLGKEVI
jgi:hypothetical protein